MISSASVPETKPSLSASYRQKHSLNSKIYIKTWKKNGLETLDLCIYCHIKTFYSFVLFPCFIKNNYSNFSSTNCRHVIHLSDTRLACFYWKEVWVLEGRTGTENGQKGNRNYFKLVGSLSCWGSKLLEVNIITVINVWNKSNEIIDFGL